MANWDDECEGLKVMCWHLRETDRMASAYFFCNRVTRIWFKPLSYVINNYVKVELFAVFLFDIHILAAGPKLIGTVLRRPIGMVGDASQQKKKKMRLRNACVPWSYWLFGTSGMERNQRVFKQKKTSAPGPRLFNEIMEETWTWTLAGAKKLREFHLCTTLLFSNPKGCIFLPFYLMK